jgi:hypothetical protein
MSLLAARILEDLLAVAPCRDALTDQFANERYMQAQLFSTGPVSYRYAAIVYKV